MTGPLEDEVVAAALHGSYCPKMCSFACPVTSATGRDDAVPWSFHRTVTDLAEGRLSADAEAARSRLTACSGCLACQVPCEFDQDVPAQVRDGRRALAAADNPVPGFRDAVEAVAAGRSPFPGRGVSASAAPAADEGGSEEAASVLLVGCRDDPATVAAAERLLAASGSTARPLRPDGCCGGALDDLGADSAAEAARSRLTEWFGRTETVLVLDPHCVPDARAAAGSRTTVRTLLEELDLRLQAGALEFVPDDRAVTYHDPCLLARRDGVTAPPRNLLRASGAQLLEPEHHEHRTRCSGGGLAMELVDPSAATATARQRRTELATGAAVTLTACSGAGHLLDDPTLEVGHLVRYLADHLGSPA